MGWKHPMTHRQFLAWQYWLSQQYNQPSRTDYYLMQVASEILKGRVKDPRKVNIEDFKIPFTIGPANKQSDRKLTENDKRLLVTHEHKLKANQSTWFAHMGKDVNVVNENGEVIDTIKNNRVGDTTNGQSGRDRESNSQHVRERFKVPGHVKDRKKQNRSAINRNRKEG